MSVDLNNLVTASRSLPQAVPDTNPTNLRAGRYGDQTTVAIINSKHGLADEGSYFIGTTPTPGTGIAMAISTAFSDTVAMFVLRNTESPNNQAAKRIYLDYLRLILGGTAPTATLARHFAFKRSPTTNRTPTTAANKTIITPVNMANASGRASICSALSYSAAAAMTVPASGTDDTVVGRVVIPCGVNVTHDQYVIRFGGEDLGSIPPLTAARATHPASLTVSAPPIIIEPGETLVIHEWCPTEATNGPTFEYELGWWER